MLKQTIVAYDGWAGAPASITEVHIHTPAALDSRLRGLVDRGEVLRLLAGEPR